MTDEIRSHNPAGPHAIPTEDLEGLEEDISIGLWNLQLWVAMLALRLPDLPERHRNLIDDVLHTVQRWGDPTLEPVTREIRAKRGATSGGARK